MNHPEQMYNYNAWANQTILNRIKELPSSVLSQEVNSSFPTIAHALSHIYAVDKMWYLVLTGTGMPEALQACMPLNGEIHGSIDEYMQMFADLSAQYSEWLQGQTNLEHTVLLDNPFAASAKPAYWKWYFIWSITGPTTEVMCLPCSVNWGMLPS